MHGSSDKKVFELAKKENRIILTHDKDFLRIVENYKQDFEGIILIKCKKQNPKNVSLAFDKLINNKVIKKITNSLVILSEEEIIIIKR